MRTLYLLSLFVGLGHGFAPRPRAQSSCLQRLHSTAEAAAEDVEQYHRFQDIATKLRTSIHGNGFDSRDPKYGVESIRAVIPILPSLGLELVEVAHSTTEANRGLVLVSGVSGNAAEHTTIQEGDTIVGVSCPAANFKESTSGLDYEATMDAIVQAKNNAELLSEASITLQINRLVSRAPIQVLVESNNGKDPAILNGLAGDNLRLLLKQNNLYFSTNDCGGEGICGSDMVEIVEGEEFVDYLGSSTSKRRKACQSIVGRDNQKATIRIRLCLGEREEA